MAYYRIVDTTIGPRDRKYLIGLGAKHLGTKVSDTAIYRKFVLDVAEDELLVLKLTLDHSADISQLTEQEINYLKETGYL